MATSTITSNAAYVVEQGTSGIWTYRKWSDGTAECWGTYSGTVTLTTVASYYHRGSISSIAYPSNLFIESPSVTASVGNTTMWCGIESNASDMIQRIHIYDIANATNFSIKINIHAFGRWN